MKERIKRLSASLLAAMMIVTYMPSMAFADDAQTEGWNTDHSKYFYYDDSNVLQSVASKSEKTAPTCAKAGDVVYTVVVNGETITYTDEGKGDPATGKHTPGKPVKEASKGEKEIKEANCTEAGKYDEVVYCTVCNQEVSRETKTPAALGHKPGEVEVKVTGDCSKGESGVKTTTTYCSVCNEVISVETDEEDIHVWDEGKVTKEATCTEDGVKTFTCTKCKATKEEPIKALGHKFTKTGKDNDVAAKCGEPGSYEEYTYCEVCGEEKPGSRHTVETEALAHDWKVVEGKTDAEGWALVSEAKTCDKKSVYERECKVCGKKETKEVQAVDHTWSAEPQMVRDDKFIKATCLHEGQHAEAKVCEKCGAIDEESYEVVEEGLGDHEWEVTATSKAPTCTATGIGNVKCKVCGEERQDEVLPKIAHTKGEAVKENVKDATCTKDGSYDSVVYCTVCKEELSKKTVNVPAFGHDLKEVAGTAKEATCTADGKKADQKCTRCDGKEEGGFVQGEVVKALGHDWEELSVTAPTCTKDGSRALKCKRCNDIHAEKIDKLDHSALKKTTAFENLVGCALNEKGDGVVSTSCKEGTYDEVVYCECGNEISRTAQTVAPALTHVWNYKYVTKPVCDEDNAKDGTASERTCSRCGQTEYFDGNAWTTTKPAKPVVTNIPGDPVYGHHNYELITKIDPECEKDGKAVYKCTECGLHYEEPIAQLGHEFNKKLSAEVDWDATSNATKAVGYVTYTLQCSNGVHTKTEIVKFDSETPGTEVAYKVSRVETPATCKDGKVVYTFAEGDLEVKNATYEVKLAAELDKDGNPVNHVWGDPEIDKANAKEPTCTEDGYYDLVRICKDCGAKKNEGERVVLEKLGHVHDNDAHPENTQKKVAGSDVEGDCIHDWTHDVADFCDRCGAELKDTRNTVVDKAAVGHTAGEAVVDETKSVEPTCYEDGSHEEVVSCTVCGKELEREKVTDPATHTWYARFDEESSLEATCTEAGYRTYKISCAVCGMDADEGQVKDMTGAEINAMLKDAGIDIVAMNQLKKNGAEFTLPVQAAGHKAEYTKQDVLVKEATATEDGLMADVTYCGICGAEIAQVNKVVLPATDVAEMAAEAKEYAESIDSSEYLEEDQAAVEAAKAALIAAAEREDVTAAELEELTEALDDAVESAELAKEIADEEKAQEEREALAEEAAAEAEEAAKTAAESKAAADKAAEEAAAAEAGTDDAVAKAEAAKAAAEKALEDAEAAQAAADKAARAAEEAYGEDSEEAAAAYEKANAAAEAAYAAEDAVAAAEDAVAKAEEDRQAANAEKEGAAAAKEAANAAKEAAKEAANNVNEDGAKAIADAQANLDKVLADEKSTAADIAAATAALNNAVAEAKAKNSKTAVHITLTDTKVAYTGKAVKMPNTPQIDSNTTGEVTYKFFDKNKNPLTEAPTEVGSYFVQAFVSADANYQSAESYIVKLTITKAAQKMTVKAKIAKAKKAKKTTIKASKAYKIKNAVGKKTFKKVSGNKKITVNKKTGKITVKKGLKKGTYKVRVKVKAAGNASYKAKTKTVTVKIKVK